MRDAPGVRTTLDIDDDVLQAVKELAEVRGVTAGQALSALVRQAMTRARPARTRNGIPVLPRRYPALFDCSRVGHRQLTDVYRLGLAQKKGGVLATFDRTIPPAAIVGSHRNLLEVVAPLDPD